MTINNRIDTELLKQINEVLSSFPKYWSQETLLKNKVVEDIRLYDEEVIKALLENALVKDTYSITLDSVTIFKVEDFIDMLRYKNYWENSYTKYSNEIGLTSEGKYLKYNTDVVLDFPHKDGVLEGAMSKEEVGKRELYYHNVLAKEEVDTLLSPKVFTNIKKFEKQDKHEITEFNETDNLIIKGNNLIALHTLRERYAGKVKLIYIDPPYNTGNDSFKYNDRFNRSTWLTFMKNRLEVAKSLLSEEGSIWINIGDEEVHYLKVLLDEIFTNGFVANIIWQKRTSPDARATLGDAHDHILVFAKNTTSFKNNLKTLPLLEEQKKRFGNSDNDARGPWVSSDFTAQGFRPNQMYTITSPSGKEYSPPPGRCWKNIEPEYLKLQQQGRMWFGINGSAMPRRKTYLAESSGRVAWTWWDNKQVGHNQEAKKESIKLFGGNDPFSTPKPERLLQQIINLYTEKGDIILDFFMGSATTQAVAHKMERQYIGVEQMDYINDYSVARLQKVIEGEQGGISKNIEWQGGGSFVYVELSSLNDRYVQDIQTASNEKLLDQVLIEMKESAYLNFKIDLERITTTDKDYQSLTLDEKKKALIQVLDMNQLYLNYSEIEDTQHDISDSVKAFNHSFYNKDGEMNE